VDPKLRGEKVQVRFDRFSDMESVLLYSLQEEYLGVGRLHHREAGGPAPHRMLPGAPSHNYLDLLVRKHQRALQARAQGIDYRELASRRQWPFIAFVKCVARLSGRRAGISSFSAEELEALKKTYNRYGDLTEDMLKRAFEESSDKSLAAILYRLKHVSRRKEN
jgi:hypothetical protein